MSIGESTGVDVVAVSRWGGDAAARAVALVRTGQYRAFTEAWLANRQLAAATRDAYRGDLGGYLDWCAGLTTLAGPPGRVEPIDPLAVVFVHLNEYARALENTIQPRTGRPYAAASVARKLSAIGSWYTFLVRLGVLARNPVDGADRPVVDRDHSPTVGLTADEATALVAAADLDPYPAAVRNRALIRLLLRLGARVSEAVGANIGDLGHADGFRTIILRMKRGKTRRRRLPEQTAAAIDTMLAARAAAAGVTVDELDPTAPLFATASGGRLHRSEVYELVECRR